MHNPNLNPTTPPNQPQNPNQPYNTMTNEYDLQTSTNKQQKIKCIYAALNIQNSRYGHLYPIGNSYNSFNNSLLNTSINTNVYNQYKRFHTYTSVFNNTNMGSNAHDQIINQLLANFKHACKKPQEKLVRMQFLKDSNFIVLGYNKQTDRGDINFIAVNQLKNRDFYYNKLTTGVGGIQCFDDGRYILIADRKGVFSFIDMFKQLNYNDIQEKKIETGYEGVLDFSISPGQTKVVCGLDDKRCIVLDIQKQRRNKKFILCNTFSRHIYGVNSVNWHPSKSLVVSSSIDLSDTVKLWDPHSQQLVHETNLNKNLVIKTMFHPQGNTYFSLCKQNMIMQTQLRKRGTVNTFHLQFQPTHMQVLNNNNVVIGDTGGYISWFTPTGQLITKMSGASGVSLFSIDQTNSILVVGRQREHMFEIYSKKNILKINRTE